MNSDCFDFRQLRSANPLFLDFLYNRDQVADFYKPSPLTSRQQLEQRLKRSLNGARYPRSRMVQVLGEDNLNLGGGEQTSRNVERLSNPNTVAVVTGQQVGLFGGPALTVYKAATAIRIADSLNAQGYSAVPIFWLASNDSDFQEVCSTHFISAQGQLVATRLPDDRSHRTQMMGSVRLHQVAQPLEILAELFEKADFGAKTLQLLRSSYLAERSFSQAFGHWLHQLFQGDGLVLFDPLSAQYQRELGGFFEVAIKKRQALVGELMQRTAILEDRGYTPQVGIEASEGLLFWVENQNRFKLKFENGAYRAKGLPTVNMSPQELLREIGEEVGRVSPSVLLRPILQDYLLPTVMYVGGPAEVAYFAQSGAISRFWEIESSIVPRASFTIVDRKTQRLLKRYHLDLDKVMNGSFPELSEALLKNSEAGEIMESFDHLVASLSTELTSLKRKLKKEDAPLAAMLENSGRKIRHQIEKVSQRYMTNYQQRTSRVRSQLAHLRSHLTPAGALQERVINFNYFIGMEGRRLVSELVARIRLPSDSHQLWYL